jgi:hypothetical protein
MPDRREFIRGTIAVTAAVAVLRAGFAAANRRQPLFRVLYDRYTSEGISFGAEAARQGVPISATGSDLGGVWMHEIEPRWQREPVAIAGLTAGAPLFCLEYLARDYGVELVYRIEHAPVEGGRVQHTVTGPGGLSGRVDALAAAGDQWPAVAAALAAEFPAVLPARPAIPLLDLAERTDRAAEPFYSWLLAPRRNVRGVRSTHPNTRIAKHA